MHFQDSLPKLPLPALEDTLKRMLIAAEPLCTREEFDEANRLAAEFEARDGPAVQAALARRDERKYSSFITEPWFDMYLCDRRPILLNSNPALIFADEEGTGRSGAGSQVGRAARLIHAAMTFDRTLTNGHLQPDIFHTAPKRSKTPMFDECVRLIPRNVSFYGAAIVGAYPLDMSQYANLLRSTRVPLAGKDELVTSTGSRHIVVQRNGAFFKVDVLAPDGGTVPLAQITGALQAVVDAADAAPAPADEHVGLLTALGRDRWSELRAQLISSSATNAAAVADIDSAIFMMSLEVTGPNETFEAGFKEATPFFLHGSGVDRWLDKSFQLILTPTGQTALNFEHAWGDGVAVMRFVNEVHEASTALPLVSTPQPPASPPTRITFGLDAGLKAGVREARAAFDKTVARTDLGNVRSEGFNSGALKKLKLSPDGAMQMAFQLAHFRMHGGLLPSTYESASTSAFKHGRTETIRSATPAAAKFVAAFANASASPAERAATMRAAVNNHTKITRDALIGNGFDRHLFALNDTASSMGLSPRLFGCAAVAKLRHIILSTSTLSSEVIVGGGFGPVNDDCYAIGYGVRPIGAEAQVITYGRDSQGFCDALGGAFDEMLQAAEVPPA